MSAIPSTVRCWIRPRIRSSAVSPTARSSPAQGHQESAPLYPASFCRGLSPRDQLAQFPRTHRRPARRYAPRCALGISNHGAPLPWWRGCDGGAAFGVSGLSQRECVGRIIRCMTVCDRKQMCRSGTEGKCTTAGRIDRRLYSKTSVRGVDCGSNCHRKRIQKKNQVQKLISKFRTPEIKKTPKEHFQYNEQFGQSSLDTGKSSSVSVSV